MAHSRVHVLRIAKSGTRFFIKSCSLQYGPDDGAPNDIDQKVESYKWIKALSPLHQQTKEENQAEQRPGRRSLPHVIQSEQRRFDHQKAIFFIRYPWK